MDPYLAMVAGLFAGFLLGWRLAWYLASDQVLALVKIVKQLRQACRSGTSQAREI